MSTESERCRVVRAIASSDTFARAADVTNPARSEWPEKSPATFALSGKSANKVRDVAAVDAVAG